MEDDTKEQMASVTDEDRLVLGSAPDRADHGCFVGVMLIMVAVFVGPTLLVLGAASLIPVILTVLLITVATPWINPAERASRKAKWIGRAITFCVLAGLTLAAIYAVKYGGFLQVRDEWDVREQ